jgi:conjugal transfer/entry exclusion protein
MGLPSYLADIEDKAADNQAMAGLFMRGTAGAAGIGSFLQTQRAATAMRKARRAEAEARNKEERARRFVDDTLAWRAATADVVPLRRKR